MSNNWFLSHTNNSREMLFYKNGSAIVAVSLNGTHTSLKPCLSTVRPYKKSLTFLLNSQLELVIRNSDASLILPQDSRFLSKQSQIQQEGTELCNVSPIRDVIHETMSGMKDVHRYTKRFSLRSPVFDKFLCVFQYQGLATSAVDTPKALLSLAADSTRKMRDIPRDWLKLKKMLVGRNGMQNRNILRRKSSNLTNVLP